MIITTFALTLSLTAGPADLSFMRGAWESASPELKLEERWTVLCQRIRRQQPA